MTFLTAQPFSPADAGTTVSGFQDDFSGASLGSGWVVRGANVYSVANGILHIASPNSDPNHLLYEVPGYNTSTQEVLVRIRVTGFSPGQYSRGGIGVGVDAATSSGINFTFRDGNYEGQVGKHTAFLDDFRAWGPGQDFVWQPNVWYWLRVRQEPNNQGGANDVFGKIWLADGTVAEPANWQLFWDYVPSRSARTGFAGLLAGSSASGDGYSEFDVDYVLIKAAGLPSIVVMAGAVAQTPVTITNQPQNQTVAEMSAATFGVGATGNPIPVYQWFRDGIPIVGATNSTYTIAKALVSDHGHEFHVVASNFVSNVVRTATSTVVSLSVIADTNPPALEAVSSVGLEQVLVRFSEMVSAESAHDLSHYTLSGSNGTVAIFNAVLDSDPSRVWLTVASLSNNATYTLTVTNIRDRASASNMLAFASMNFVARELTVRITEFLAENALGLTDSDGEHSDWIELQNQGPAAVDLAGWRLTDDWQNLALWVFPSTVLQPSQFLTVFASGKNRRISGAELHTNFKLSSGGEYLALVRPNGTVVQEFDFGPQRKDVSYGVVGDTNLFMPQPTPGQTNGAGVLGFVEDTKFTPRRGFYSNTVSLSITSATPAAEIWFTTDGTAPSPNAAGSTRYTGLIGISNTTTLRARAFLANYVASDVDTHSYLFTATAARQSETPPGFPLTWSDYGMNQQIVNQALPPYDITNALLSLPAVSLVLPIASTFGPQGIYLNSTQVGDAWERETSIEMIFPDGTDGFQADAGLRMHGYSSRGHGFTRKHSLHLNFRSRYGPSKLHFPLFPDTEVNDFDQIVLRASSTDSFPCYDINLSRWDPRRATYIRDQWMRDAMRDLGHPTSHGRYVHLWLNGLYWGQYNLAELLGDDFAANYFGGNREDYDVLKDDLIVDGGDASRWNELQSMVAGGVTTETLYQRAQGNNPDGTRNPSYPVYLNLPNYIDFMMLHITAGAEDFPNNNWWSCRNRGPDSDGFHFVPWDQEISNESLTRTVNAWGERFEEVATIDRAGYFYDKLRRYVNFRQLFMDRVWFTLSADGPLSSAKNAARWLARQNEIDRSIVAESARWGDSSHSPASTRANWLNEMNFVANYWASNQVRAIQRFRNVNLWPLLGPPSLSRSNGYFTNQVSITITHTNPAGTIWFTVDGTDARSASGAPASTAQSYTAPVSLTNSTRVRARVTDGTNWSPPITGVFLPIGALTNLVITEIHYNPAGQPNVGSDAFEFIELQNRSAFPLDLSGVHFTAGITFAFTNGTTLAPNAFAVLARDRTNFAALFPAVSVHGAFGGKLDNAGESLALADSLGNELSRFSYGDSSPWPANADGFGDSLQRIHFTVSPSEASEWAAASPTPGTASPLLDTDADGLPDVWESANGLNPKDASGNNGASGDPDGDGRTNLQEFRAGTNPTNSSSVMRFETVTAGAQIVFSFRAASNKSYTVEFTPALGGFPWVALTNIVSHPTNRTVLIADAAVSSNRFYRLVTP